MSSSPKSPKSRSGAGASPRHHSTAITQAPYFKYLVLIFLSMNTSLTVMLMRYSRTRTEEANIYIASTAVFLAEVLKVAVCVGTLFWQIGVLPGLRQLNSDILFSPFETAKLVIPAGLYALQNNLLYTALTHLDSVTYQVTYQLKILTTAVFSVLVLRRRLRSKQWMALFVLFVGVVLVQLSNLENPTKTPTVNEREAEESHDSWQRQLTGLLAVLISCASSGFSGVYFEKLVKMGKQTNVIIRNLQLGILSVPLAFLGVVLSDREAVNAKGFFHGYDALVYTIVFLQAFGGLLVALTVKYADNILKGFATSISIVIVTVATVGLGLGTATANATAGLGTMFYAGTAMVVGSTALYHIEADA